MVCINSYGNEKIFRKKYGGLARYYVNAPELYRRFRQYIDVLGSGIVILQSNSKCFTGHADIWFEEKYLFAKKQLENMGFEIVEGNLVKDKVYQGYRTASAKERAEEMMELVKK